MKILMLNHFPLTGSGSGTYTRNIAVQLASRGHEVRIIMPENTDHFSVPDGVTVHPVFFTDEPSSRQDVFDGRTMDTALPFNFPCFTSHPRSSVTFGDLNDEQLKMYTDVFRTVIEEELEDFRPDIIHAQHAWIMPALAAEHHVPIVITVHGTDLMGYDKWPRLRTYAKAAVDAAGAVISISKDSSRLIEARFPKDRDKIILVRNGYDPAVFRPKKLTREEVLGRYYGIEDADYKDARIVTYAGKLTWFKGVDILLEAIRLYEDREPKSLTLIIGDGDERDNLHWKAKDIRLKSVRFLDNIEQDELCRIYNVADVSLVPSRHEPFGLAAVEAMACGVPIIATNQGGLPDFVNDSVGRLVTPGDALELADRVTEVLKITANENNSKWRRKIAAYARENFAQDRIILQLENLYETVIGRKTAE